MSKNNPIVNQNANKLAVSQELSALNKDKLEDLYLSGYYKKLLETGKAVVIKRTRPVVRFVRDSVTDLVIVNVDDIANWKALDSDVVPHEFNAPFVADPYCQYDIDDEKIELTTGTVVIGDRKVIDEPVDSFFE